MNPEFNFGPAYFPGLFGANGKLPSFCKGNSSTQSNPNNSQTVTDQRVASSEGSIAATQGSTVNVQNVDADVVKQATDSVTAIAALNAQTTGEVSKSAVEENSAVAKAALSSNNNAVSDAISFGEHVSDNSFGFAGDVASKALDTFAKTQQDTNALIQRTNEQFSAGLKDNSGIAPTSAADNLVKYLTIGATVLGVVFAFVQLKKGKS